MTLRECYETVGGSYDRVVERLGSAALVDKYIRRVPGDRSYQMLLDAMAAHRDEEAFRAAHTLKGFCLTLGLDDLASSAGELTEALCHGRTPEADGLLRKVTADYERTVRAIAQLPARKESAGHI